MPLVLSPRLNNAKKLLAFIPVVLILVFILIFYLTEGVRIFSFDVIQEEHLKWKTFVQQKPLLSALYFIGVYTVSVILVIPDSTFLTLLGGFLFPMPLAIAYACIAETIGATIFFGAVKLAFTGTLGKRKEHPLHNLLIKFQSNQASYLLFLRLSHLLPFWITNTGAAVFHARTSTFIWTTLIGVLPLTFFLVNGAESLSKYFDTHTHFHVKDIFTTQLKISLIALGCIALLPIFFKKFLTKRK